MVQDLKFNIGDGKVDTRGVMWTGGIVNGGRDPRVPRGHKRSKVGSAFLLVFVKRVC